jgi:hypothetical protein
VNAVPNPLILRKSGSTKNRSRTSGFVARNSDSYSTEAVKETVLGRVNWGGACSMIGKYQNGMSSSVNDLLNLKFLSARK